MSQRPSFLAALYRFLTGWRADPLVDNPVAGRFRARQLQALTRLTPLAMATNAANAALVCWGAWETASHPFLLSWAGLMWLLAASGFWQWWRRFQRPLPERASLRAIRRATVQAAALAALWAAMPVVLFPGSPHDLQLLVACVATGMICAGGFVLATVPTAGLAYVGVMGLGSALALALSNLPIAPVLGGLLVFYTGLIGMSVISMSRSFGARVLAEAEAEHQQEVIGLLLRDFEENASDLLWEIGPEGSLRHVSTRLAQALGQPVEALSDTPVLRLLAGRLPPGDEARSMLERLRQALSAGAPFRDLPLPMSRQGQVVWWSLSAKPLLGERGKVEGWRGVASDITAARSATRQLSWLAHNDVLTGLANRYCFRMELDQRLKDPAGREFAVFCLDLDHFKGVNDRLGHAAGDQLLKTVARRLNEVSPSGRFLVARLGGDEFAVLMRRASLSDAQDYARRLMGVLRQPCVQDGLQLSTQASLGIALAPRDGSDVDTLLNNADLALYAAKSGGRNEACVYTPALADTSRRRTLIEQALRGAVERRELYLVYQPQVHLSDWRITGFEALLRWEHPQLGAVQPAEFVPVAESAGLMPEIGDWVLQQACREAVRWPGERVVSVNVSPMQALSADFVARVSQVLQGCGLPAGRLELEITESAFLHETTATMSALKALRQNGVRIALDDFGTGYSALAYLRRIRFDTLKIDRSFVSELGTRGDARSIVKMILGLAQTLGIHTVAEGVEEPTHAEVLKRHGCDTIQGWLIARAMPAEAVPPFLHNWGGKPSAPAPEVQDTDAMPMVPSGFH